MPSVLNVEEDATEIPAMLRLITNNTSHAHQCQCHVHQHQSHAHQHRAHLAGDITKRKNATCRLSNAKKAAAVLLPVVLLAEIPVHQSLFAIVLHRAVLLHVLHHHQVAVALSLLKNVRNM